MKIDLHGARAGVVGAGGLALSALFILWLGNATNIDIALADAVFDPATRSFPMQHAWLAERFNHVILKTALSAAAALCCVLALWDAWRPERRWSGARRIGMRVVAMSAVLVPLAISLLKQASASHCPWNLQRYGGVAPYVRLMEWMPAGVNPGHCLPAGHASSALWLIALAAFWWPHARAKAVAVGLAMLLLGLGVGWLQQVRGAHFLTHTLWSAWVALAVIFVLYQVNAKGLAQPRGAGYNSVPRSDALS